MVNPTTTCPKPRRACTASLRPQGFHAWLFIAARILNFGALATLVAFIGRFLALPEKERQNQDTSLIATLVLTNLALFWTVVSWSGYSKRLIRYAITWTIDLGFVIAFVGQIALIGVFLQNSPICTDPKNKKKTPAICQTLHHIWFLSVAICGLFAVSGFTIGWVHLSGRRPGSPTLEAVAVDRSVGRGSRPGQSKLRISPATATPRPLHRDMEVLQLANEVYRRPQPNKVRVEDVRSAQTMPSRVRENCTDLDSIDSGLWQPAHNARPGTSHHISATAPMKPPSRRRHTNNVLASFASEPQLRNRGRAIDHRAKSVGALSGRSRATPRNESPQQAKRTRGQLAAADILGHASGTADGGAGVGRKAKTYFESIASPVPIRPPRSFSPVSWTGNTTCSSEDGESPRDSSMGEIPIRLSKSPATTPTTSRSLYACRVSGEDCRKADPEVYILPKTTYVAPLRYSASSYETEYVPSSSADSIPENGPNGNVQDEMRGAMPVPSQPRSGAPSHGSPRSPTLSPTPWSRAVSEGPFSRLEEGSLIQSPPTAPGDAAAQTRQSTNKPRKSWWKLGFRGREDVSEHPIELGNAQ
ncbi:hypothetical protein QBC34DRAFT_55100 [Podospora aff. communis PSN243]|uniref:MARVEL domain-containing protein n=1 Tax=Podospora aff. communis PSN243 TaxID=3040156 RepID=A0AAV9GUJ9_9PEZI|nr:hypothetical protein QBC34DRAFT_55100 [Podospora aff. communis PSN243]